jgi:D-aminopeptidase
VNILQNKNKRPRDLGIPFDGLPGKFNAITDVPGVEVGFKTIVEEAKTGKPEVGEGPVRTGVTAILPRGKRSFADYVFAGWFSLNGYGEMTGAHYIEETGFMQGPFMLTNTCSVGVVRDAVDQWAVQHGFFMHLSTVAETSDLYLNDMHGFHVSKEHAFAAIEAASSGEVAEGNFGGGTGMICYGFKGGTGTSSRMIEAGGHEYALGVLVQSNHGNPDQLVVAGVSVGSELPKELGLFRGSARRSRQQDSDKSSIIIVIATNAPLLPHQLKRLARRASLGLARTGSISSNGSGDIFLAFSTANQEAALKLGELDVTMLQNTELDPIFEATVQATEEAIINSLIAAETMVGFSGKVNALPRDRLLEILRNHNRLANVSL